MLPLTLAQPFIKDGKVKAFGVTSLARSERCPSGLAETPELKGLEMDRGSACWRPPAHPAVTAAWRRSRRALADPGSGARGRGSSRS